MPTRRTFLQQAAALAAAWSPCAHEPCRPAALQDGPAALHDPRCDGARRGRHAQAHRGLGLPGGRDLRVRSRGHRLLQAAGARLRADASRSRADQPERSLRPEPVRDGERRRHQSLRRPLHRGGAAGRATATSPGRSSSRRSGRSSRSRGSSAGSTRSASGSPRAACSSRITTTASSSPSRTAASPTTSFCARPIPSWSSCSSISTGSRTTRSSRPATGSSARRAAT